MTDLFTDDNFTSRRTTGHNLYDPESLMSGEEANKGMTYDNSRRAWPNEESYRQAVSGGMPTEEILRIAPRRRHPATLIFN